jgi:hypothetical protein
LERIIKKSGLTKLSDKYGGIKMRTRIWKVCLIIFIGAVIFFGTIVFFETFYFSKNDNVIKEPVMPISPKVVEAFKYIQTDKILVTVPKDSDLYKILEEYVHIDILFKRKGIKWYYVKNSQDGYNIAITMETKKKEKENK